MVCVGGCVCVSVCLFLSLFFSIEVKGLYRSDQGLKQGRPSGQWPAKLHAGPQN